MHLRIDLTFGNPDDHTMITGPVPTHLIERYKKTDPALAGLTDDQIEQKLAHLRPRAIDPDVIGKDGQFVVDCGDFSDVALEGATEAFGQHIRAAWEELPERKAWVKAQAALKKTPI
jgi:hypothetical protein